MRLWKFLVVAPLIMGLCSCSTVTRKSTSESQAKKEQGHYKARRWETPSSLARGARFWKWAPGTGPLPPGPR
jgi:hypothetical protein